MSDHEIDLLLEPQSPLPKPGPEAVASAQAEATTGSPELARSGYYVAIARRAENGPVEPSQGERHEILVIEDDPHMVRLMGEVLEMAGFATRFASHGAEINAELRKRPPPDLVLLDVTLPDADGFVILERLRSHPRVGRLPVILVTGKSDMADVARGLALGADGYVSKPFRVTALVTAVNTVLGLA